jgi:MinD superfamily P-loop ATPase
MIVIDKEICDFCGTCVAVCHPDAIFLTERDIVIDREKCTECENCIVVCPVGAVRRDAGEA